MSVETFKIIALVAILITGIAGGLLSRILSAGKKSELVFTMGNAFAGGVFLGAGVIHMLPDAREGFEALLGEVEFSHHQSQWLKFGLVALGLGVMAIVAIWT